MATKSTGRKYGRGKYGAGTYDLNGGPIIWGDWIPIADPPPGERWIPVTIPTPPETV